MYIEKIRAKILSGKNYLVKDENGERTNELGIMGLVLLLDFKENKPLNNRIFEAMISKPITDNEYVEDYEKKGYKGLVDLNKISFGQEVVISADIPLKDDFSERIKLYDMQLI